MPVPSNDLDYKKIKVKTVKTKFISLEPSFKISLTGLNPEDSQDYLEALVDGANDSSLILYAIERALERKHFQILDILNEAYPEFFTKPHVLKTLANKIIKTIEQEDVKTYQFFDSFVEDFRILTQELLALKTNSHIKVFIFKQQLQEAKSRNLVYHSAFGVHENHYFVHSTLSRYNMFGGSADPIFEALKYAITKERDDKISEIIVEGLLKKYRLYFVGDGSHKGYLSDWNIYRTICYRLLVNPAYTGNLELVKLVHDSFIAACTPADQLFEIIKTAFANAAGCKQVHVMEYLLAAVTDPAEQKMMFNHALPVAAEWGRVAIVKDLLSKGADVDFVMEGDSRTALMSATDQLHTVEHYLQWRREHFEPYKDYAPNQSYHPNLSVNDQWEQVMLKQGYDLYRELTPEELANEIERRPTVQDYIEVAQVLEDYRAKLEVHQGDLTPKLHVSFR